VAAIAQHRDGVGKLGDGERRVAPITVSTYASATTWAARIGDRFGLVVVDEAHHVGAECPREVLEMLVAPARLGLTATPADNAALAAHVGGVVYALEVKDLVGDALADFDDVAVPIELTHPEQDRYRTARRRFASEYAPFQAANPFATWSDFVQHASKTRDGREALAAWRRSREIVAFPAGKRAKLVELLARHADARVLVFTSDNATAYAIAGELLVSPITHEIKRAERAATLDRFRRGEANVLVSAQVLDEGLDVPEADVAIVVGGSGSKRRHVQRIGRVLRPRAGKRAIVYELTVSSTVEVAQARKRSVS
jgi:superfamily II DNA or RNA helicase